MVKLFVDAGIIVLAVFVSPFIADRERIRSMFNPGEFIEVYVNCPVEVCSSRNSKGIYKRARAGEIENLTGISSPYEEPKNPDIVIRSDQESAIEASEKVLKYLEDFIFHPSGAGTK